MNHCARIKSRERGIPPLCRFSDSIIDNLHFPFKCAGIYIVTFHSAVLAEHPSPPARAGQGDSLQSPGTGAAFGDWFAPSPPPACCWGRVHPQCAPTPPKSAAVRLHQRGIKQTLFLQRWLCYRGLALIPSQKKTVFQSRKAAFFL